MTKFKSLLNEPVPPEDRSKTRREQFAQANASEALEGLIASDLDLGIQERVIRGELTHDQAVAEYIALAGQGGE